MLGKCLMKGGIEDRDLGHACTKTRARCCDALDICRIMKWRKLDAISDATQDFIANQRRDLEVLATMHHSMPNRVNISDTIHGADPRFRGNNPTQDHFNGRTGVPDRRG